MNHTHRLPIVHAEELPKLAPREFSVLPTSALEKLFPSLLNAVIAFGLATPALLLWGPDFRWKISVIALFALYESYVFLARKDRCFGMKVMDTYWGKRYTVWHHIVYNTLYTASFATLFLQVWFPLDIFLINIFLIQFPFVLLTGTTLHGYLSGMTTVKIVPKS
jgi:hypothetical protein